MGGNTEICRPLARDWKLHLAEQQIRLGQVGTAFPVEFRLAAAVARRDRLSILPCAPERNVILQIAADAREVLDDGNAVLPKLIAIADPRQHE